jgi:VWFA-related protein
MAMFLQKSSHGVRVLLIAVLTLLSGSSLFTQDEPKTAPTFGSTTDIVNVFATVRDKRGAYVTKLSKDDFTVKEDGRKQEIENFQREVDLPLTIGMVIDCSPSMAGVAEQLKIASKAFFNKMIRPDKNDKVLIMKFRDIIRTGRTMSFDGQIELLQDLTSKPVEIDKAAGLIAWGGITGTNWDAEFQTMLSDSIIFATTKRMMQLDPESRRALIVLGDGYHVGNHLDLAIQTAQEANAQIYSIHIYDPTFGTTFNNNAWGSDTSGEPGMGGSNPKSAFSGKGWELPPGFKFAGQQEVTTYAGNLQMLSGRTGGNYYEYSGKNSLEQIYAEIEEELRSQYSLGYMPDSKNPGFRKIRVTVNKEGMIVHAREGYWPSKSSTSKSSTSKSSSKQK